VSAALTGLSPNTTYHYRLVATNPSDTTLGADRAFTTNPAANPPLPAPPGPASPPGPARPGKGSFGGSRTSITVDRERRFSFSLRAGVGLNGTAVFRSANKIRSSIRTRRKQPVTVARRSFRAPASGKVRLKIHAVAPELSHPPAQPKDPHTGDRHAAQRRRAEQHGEQTDHPQGAQTTRFSPEAPRLHDR
jgi:hypothetical protein